MPAAQVSVQTNHPSFFFCKAVESLTVANDVFVDVGHITCFQNGCFPSGMCLEGRHCARPLTGVRKGHSHGEQGPGVDRGPQGQQSHTVFYVPKSLFGF
jgi:hypothetical protein